MAELKKWLVVTVRAPSNEPVDALSEGLLALGGSAVHELDGELVTFLPPPDDLDNWLQYAAHRLNAEINWSWQEDQDWSETWKAGLQPRRVGRRFIVAPTWTMPNVRDGERVILIDPEMAFGTGEHATTRGALRFIEACVRKNDRVLDVGTGSAILAIGAAMCGAREVLGVEYDVDAIINAKDNIVRNDVDGVVRLDTAMVDDAYLQNCGDQSFDLITANVLSSVLHPLLPAFRRALRPDGYLILGGILESEADDMIEAATRSHFTLRAEDLEEEWWGGLFQRTA